MPRFAPFARGLGAAVLLGWGGLIAAAEPPARLSEVPGPWEERHPADLGTHDGFVWYRCRVAVPATWIDRKLYADSLVLGVGRVADAHEAYLNGHKLGAAGKFPPEFESGFAVERRYKIAAGMLRKDRDNVLAVRVYNRTGPGGFRGAAPFLSAYEHEIKLAGPWELLPRDDPAFAATDPDKIPAEARFTKVEEASSALRPTDELVRGERLPPAESLAKLTAADDLAVDQVLTEPLVGQPLHLSFDERGRLWVVQYRQYPYPAGLEMVSRNKYYRAVYDKVPPPPPHHAPGRDRISIHEDTDGDGKYDVHKIFLDGMNIVTSCVRGRGGVWVLNPPYLLFYPDANDDDVPDGDPVVHLSGFGLEDTHSAANSLSWGPDGRLYSTQGSNTVAHIRKGTDGPVLGRMDGAGVWRYDPAAGRFEVFAEGGGNAFALEIDSVGRIYSGHNGGDTRGFHYVQGGYYPKGYEGKFMPVSNPYSFGLLPAMHHGKAARFTHALVRYEGTGLPPSYRDRLLCVDPLNNLVTTTEVTPLGSSFSTRDLPPALVSKDIGFRPVAIAAGPDGAVYVADFYEQYIAHGQHYQGQIDPDSGRVYRLRAKDFHSSKSVNYGKFTTAELIETLNSPERTVRQIALRLLLDRQDKTSLPELRRLIAAETGQWALEALWAWHGQGGRDAETFAAALRHPHFGVRMWAVRFLGEDDDAPAAARATLPELALRETQPEVLSQLASGARRLPLDLGLAVTFALAKRGDFADDPYLPLLVWWSLEAHATRDPDAVLARFSTPEVWDEPLVKGDLLERLMRRFAGAGTRDGLRHATRLFRQAPTGGHSQQLLRGFNAAFSGRSFGELPTELVQELVKIGGGRALEFRLRLGQPEALPEALAELRRADAPAERRRNLAELLGDSKQPEVTAALLDVLGPGVPDEVRLAALSALQKRDEPGIAAALSARRRDFSPDVAAAAAAVLASRAAWAREWTAAIASGKAPAADLTPELAEQLRRFEDRELTARLEKLRPKPAVATSAELKAAIERRRAVLAGGPGNPYAGRLLYEERCGKCHQLFGLGGKIGPDLTPLKRDDLGALLTNVLAPSAEIREGFESYVAVTVDGQIVTGFLADQDATTILLRTQDGRTVRLLREELDELNKSGRSLMPDNLLDGLDDKQLRDLFAYLRSSQPGR